VALPPPPPPPPPPPSPCQLCQRCISDFRSTALATATLTDTAAIAKAVYTRCSALDAYTDLQCSQLRTEVATSFQGNSGKRAAVICARLQQCNPGTLPASCSLTSGSLNAALSMCSVEGVTGGAAVSGIAADNGEWHWTGCPVRICSQMDAELQ
jgi:Tfp pilus assembly protein PilW